MSLTRGAEDMKYFVRIVDHDLKINIGAKFVFAAMHPNGTAALPVIEHNWSGVSRRF